MDQNTWFFFVTHFVSLNSMKYQTMNFIIGEDLFMADRQFFGGGDGLFGGNWAILFFILVFLILFWGWGGFGYGVDPKE